MPEQTTDHVTKIQQTKSEMGACKRFECRVIGYPRPCVRWFKDGQNITAEGRYKFDYTADGCVVLILDNVTSRDQGVYECRAENTEGTAETAARLFVKGAWSGTDSEDVSVLSMSFRPTETSTPRSQRRPLVLTEDVVVTPSGNEHFDDSLDTSNVHGPARPTDAYDTHTTGDDTHPDSSKPSDKELKSSKTTSADETDNSRRDIDENNTSSDEFDSVIEQREKTGREGSANTSEDSVLGIESEIQCSTSDKDSVKNVNATSESNIDQNNKPKADGGFSFNTDVSNTIHDNDDALTFNTTNEQVPDTTEHQATLSDLCSKYEEVDRDIEDVVNMEKSGDLTSRRWGTDSGVASRGSSMSSDADLGITHDSMLEMQEYLHGKRDTLYESFEQTLETTVEHGIQTSIVNRDVQTSAASMLDIKHNSEQLACKSVESACAETVSSRSHSEDTNMTLTDDIFQRHTAIDEKGNDLPWESIDDVEQMVIAGKFLFAKGPGIENVEGISHGLSEMEKIEQHEDSQMLASESEIRQSGKQMATCASSESEMTIKKTQISTTELGEHGMAIESTEQIHVKRNIGKLTDISTEGTHEVLNKAITENSLIQNATAVAAEQETLVSIKTSELQQKSTTITSAESIGLVNTESQLLSSVTVTETSSEELITSTDELDSAIVETEKVREENVDDSNVNVSDMRYIIETQNVEKGNSELTSTSAIEMYDKRSGITSTASMAPTVTTYDDDSDKSDNVLETQTEKLSESTIEQPSDVASADCNTIVDDKGLQVDAKVSAEAISSKSEEEVEKSIELNKEGHVDILTDETNALISITRSNDSDIPDTVEAQNEHLSDNKYTEATTIEGEHESHVISIEPTDEIHTAIITEEIKQCESASICDDAVTSADHKTTEDDEDLQVHADVSSETISSKSEAELDNVTELNKQGHVDISTDKKNVDLIELSNIKTYFSNEKPIVTEADEAITSEPHAPPEQHDKYIDITEESAIKTETEGMLNGDIEKSKSTSPSDGSEMIDTELEEVENANNSRTQHYAETDIAAIESSQSERKLDEQSGIIESITESKLDDKTSTSISVSEQSNEMLDTPTDADNEILPLETEMKAENTIQLEKPTDYGPNRSDTPIDEKDQHDDNKITDSAAIIEDADEDTSVSSHSIDHKRMEREDIAQGKLDYKFADDAEARLAAGRYLFYCATPDIEEEHRHETAHELHYWREAEPEEPEVETSISTEMELPVTEIINATESSSDMQGKGHATELIGSTQDSQVEGLQVSEEADENVCSESSISKDEVKQIDKQDISSAKELKDKSNHPATAFLEATAEESVSTRADELPVSDTDSTGAGTKMATGMKEEQESTQTDVETGDNTKGKEATSETQPFIAPIKAVSVEAEAMTIAKTQKSLETDVLPETDTSNEEKTVKPSHDTLVEISATTETKQLSKEAFDGGNENITTTSDTSATDKLKISETKEETNKDTSEKPELTIGESCNLQIKESDSTPEIFKPGDKEILSDEKRKEQEYKECNVSRAIDHLGESMDNTSGIIKPDYKKLQSDETSKEQASQIETQVDFEKQNQSGETLSEYKKDKVSTAIDQVGESMVKETSVSKEQADVVSLSQSENGWMDLSESGMLEFKVNVCTEWTEKPPTNEKEQSESDTTTCQTAVVDVFTTPDSDDVDVPGVTVADKQQTEGAIVAATTTTEAATGPIVTTMVDIVEAETSDVRVAEGQPLHIQWKILDVAETSCHVYKDGFKVQPDNRLVLTYRAGLCTLDVEFAAPSDEATYSIRVGNREEDFGCIEVRVTGLESAIARTTSEPAFLVEPTVEIENGRRLSIKCSVCGVPEPEVTWFIEGQQLGHGALWDTYSKDGFYHLGLDDPSVLDCEEIVCRVENEAGFIQNVLKLKREAYEISLEPVLPTAEVVTPEFRDAPPTLNLEITESKERYKKLKQYILPDDACDKDNLVTFKQGEIVELLGSNQAGGLLARNTRQKKKIGYLPIQMMLDKYGPADDVRTSESQSPAIRQTPERKQIGTTQQQNTQEEAPPSPTMPERRHLTASSPGLHGTPRKKPKDRESPSELDTRLGFKESLTAKKDMSHDQVRLTEYEDGTSRPMFKRRLRKIVADEGQLSQLECVVSGTPMPKVLWLKNNRPLKASDGCQVVVNEESNILVFPKVSEDDAGVYTARAMNVNGSVMCTTELALSDGKAVDPGKELDGTPMDLDFTTPAYFFQMSSCQVEEGRLARFDCRVVAYPKPEIVWMKDGKVVESEDRFKLLNFNSDIFSLLIKDVQLEDSGRYTCWARNKFGEAMTEAHLTVVSLSAEDEQEGDIPPRFLTKFYDQQTTEGLEAEFKCLIGGRPAPSVTWLLDDIELQDAPGVRLRRKDGVASLDVKSPTIDQSGQFTCHISNELGEATCSAHLTVIENKLRGKMLPKFLKKFDHVTVREGEEAIFTTVVVGEPKATVTWMYNDKPLDASRRYVMKQDGDTYTLTVKNARFDDSGKISCKAVNEEGQVYCYGNLLVRESRFMRDTPEKLPYKPETAKVSDPKFGYVPTFTKRLQDLSVNEGGQTRLECKVMGIPDPEVSWMKDGRVIPPVGRYHVTRDGETCRLTIDNVRPDDQGVYTCIVSNPQGKSSSSAELKIAGAGKKDYTPDRLLTDTYVKRPYGESPEKFDVLPKILSVPKIPYDRPTLLNKRDDSATLAWLPAPTHDLPTDGRRVSYTIESKEIGGPRRDWTTVATDVPGTTYNARHLRPDREYEFRVRAQNQYGISEPTRSSTLVKRADEAEKYAELPEVRAPPRLPTHRPIITDMGEETVRLAWRPVEPYKSKRTPPVSYRLEAKELPGRDWMPISDSLRETTHYLSDLSKERDYMIRVRAENDFGVSEPTEPLWLPRATSFPGVPISRPQIVELEPQRAKLSWSRVDIPTFGLDDVPLTYMLEAAEPPHDWRTIARDIDDTDYTVDGLKPGRDYRFRVRAKTPSGAVSEPSPAVSLYSTLAKSRAPVDHLEVLDLEPDTMSAHLGWRRVDIPSYGAGDEPLMYMIEYQEPPLDDWRPLVTGVPTSQYRVMNLDPERDYNFRVRALTPYGVSPPSATLPVSLRHTPATRRLSEPVVISEVEAESLRLSWRRPMVDPSQDVSYEIQTLEQPLLDWRPLATGVTATTYKVTGLWPKRDYQFRVIPRIGSRSLEPTPSVALSATAVRPRLHLAEPKLTELGPESVLLSWRPAEFPAYERKKPSIYYGVEKMELPSGNWVPVARRLADTQHTVTGLRPDRDYKFRVTAETDSLAASEPSMSAMLYRRPAPVFPRDEPVIRDLSANIVTMAWKPAAIPSGLARPPNVTYNVEMQSPPGMSAWTTLHTAHPTPSVRLADLRPDRDYLVRVSAQYDDHVTEPTLPVYIPRRAVPPRLPNEEPYVVDIQPDSVKLQWRSADLPMHILDYSPISYRVEGRESPAGAWVTVARGVPHTDFKITGLMPDKDYEFRVKAENTYGVSDPTRPTVVTKRAVAPIMAHDEPLMYDIGPGSARVSWRPASMPSHLPRTSPITYTIQVQETPLKTWRPFIKRIPHTSYYVSGLDPTKDYNFRVVADNDFGSSRPTQPVYMPRYADLSIRRPISMPEVDEFDDDLTSVKLHWKPRAGSPFDSYPGAYQIESWEPVRREWRSVAKGIPGTSYHLRDLPALPDHLFRVRMETDHAALSEPSLPVSVRRHLGHPRMPVHRPQLYEVDTDSAMLSWQPAHVPSRRPVRYTVEQREIPETKWRSVSADTLESSCRLRGLRPRSDYEFRVRALIDGETSEPSFPVPLYRKAGIPRVQFDTPEVYDVEDNALSLRWNKVDVPAFSSGEEPLTFIVERQLLPSYEWEPVCTDVTDSSYRVKDLQPYQDYSFRVRGYYPSGYTEPSPAVPVYRRPSESRLYLASSYRHSVVTDKLQPTNQKLPQQNLLTNRKRPTPIRRSRRYSLPQIYDINDSISALKEASFKSITPAYVPKFKVDDAYVYKRKEIKPQTPPNALRQHTPVAKKNVKPRMSRRHSDVGLGISDWYVPVPRIQAEGYADKALEERVNIAKYSFATETHTRSISLPKRIEALDLGQTEYRSVADRYEDIKCPYIMRPHILFPRRRSSISLDPQDFADLRKKGSLQFHSQARSRSTSAERNITRGDIGIHSHVAPRLSRIDLGKRSNQMSHEEDYGYFAVSKFSLTVAGARRPLLPSYPLELSPPTARTLSRSPLRHQDVPSFRSRSFTPELVDYQYSQRSRSLSQSLSEWNELSKEMDTTLNRVKEGKRSLSANTPSVTITSVTSSKKTDTKRASRQPFTRPRSNSICTDIPLMHDIRSTMETTTPKPGECKFNAFKLIHDSKLLQHKVERYSKPNEPQTPVVTERRQSVKSEVRFVSTMSITPTIKTSKTTKPDKPQVHHDVKLDPRFTRRRRHSVADPTGDFLKHRLDSLNQKLLEPKPLRGSTKHVKSGIASSRSPRRSHIGEPMRTSREPSYSGLSRDLLRSDKLAYIARSLQA